MKNLLLIGGPMGIGKTSVCQQLKKQLPGSVFLDGDWCWDADPFCVTTETKKMVLENIRYLLSSFLHCSAYQNVIFCWVLHEQGILDAVLSGLDISGCKVTALSLVASPQALTERIDADIERGLRTQDVLPRSLAYLPRYEELNTAKIDTTGKSVQEVTEGIIRMIDYENCHMEC